MEAGVRNDLVGKVEEIKTDGMMAQVKIQLSNP